jgi:hypothetical protein
MNKRELPSQEYLNSILEYKDGELFWKIDKGAAKVGKQTSYINNKGYKIIRIDKVDYLQHRLIWKMLKEHDPIGHIDHINHDKLDNKIENLRDVSRSENQRNRALNKNNTSGQNNIYKQKDKYRVRFKHNKISKYFNNLEDAVSFRDEKYLELGYHENHGK